MAKYRGVEIDLKPTEAMANNAQRGLDWRKEFNRGGTDVGVARARQLVNRQELSPDTVRRMKSFFARHKVDKDAEGFNSGEDGFPSAGRVAWDLWGGDAGKTWADRKDKQLDRIDEKGNGMSIEKKFLTVGFELKNYEENDDYFNFEGYASTFDNVDLGNDRMISGAFKNTIRKYMDGRKNLPVLWQHDMKMPLGTYTEMREDMNGLYVKGRMPKEDDFVRGRVMPQMKAGSVSAMSIGYVVRDYDYDQEVRNLKEVDLFEVSLVTMPMNPEAMVTDMKMAVPFYDLPLASRDRAWDSDAAISRVREFTGSTEEPEDRYKEAFLYYDPEDDDNFGAYKLPIADVIDGELKAVPRAIFAAAGALSGARGGVDIPDADRSKITANIDRYYRKMGLDSPFKEKRSYRIDDLHVFTERELEKLLKDGVSFTGESAKTIISALKNLKRDVDGEGREAKQRRELLALLNDTTTQLKKV